MLRKNYWKGPKGAKNFQQYQLDCVKKRPLRAVIDHRCLAVFLVFARFGGAKVNEGEGEIAVFSAKILDRRNN